MATTDPAPGNADFRPARLNYHGDLTGEGLEGFVGSFPYLTRDGGAHERRLTVTAVTYDAARHVSTVELSPA